MGNTRPVDGKHEVKTIAAGHQTLAGYGIVLDDKTRRLRIQIVESGAPSGMFRGRYTTNKTVSASVSLGTQVYEGDLINLTRLQAEGFEFFGDVSGGGTKEIEFEQFQNEQGRL